MKRLDYIICIICIILIAVHAGLFAVWRVACAGGYLVSCALASVTSLRHHHHLQVLDYCRIVQTCRREILEDSKNIIEEKKESPSGLH
jgi:hypothetical protein